MPSISQVLALVHPSRERRFWNWFAENSERYLDVESDRDALFEALGVRLTRIHPSMTFEFGRRTDSGRELVISADGIRAVVPAVQRLVAAAPPLKHWTITSFRQRGDPGCSIQFQGLTLGPENLWFRLEADRDKVGISLYLPPPVSPEDEAVIGAIFILLDNALGEYDMVTKIGFVERLAAPPDPASKGLSRFIELPAAMDRLYAQIHHT